MITEVKIVKAKELIDNCDIILIGAGAGISTAAGIKYNGARFTKNFPDFIEKFGLTDMYSSMFYMFPNLETRWAYVSRHIILNRYDTGACKLYIDLFKMVKEKEYFVLTTNGDGQFYESGFDKDKIFATQGDYKKFQCVNACHDTLYDNKKIVYNMVEQQKNCEVPSELIPKCPICGEDLVPHLRIDGNFVENKHWHEMSDRYSNFVANLQGKKVVLLELGVGFNTPTIIRWPFERITATDDNFTLIRVNFDTVDNYIPVDDQSLLIEGDIGEFIERLL